MKGILKTELKRAFYNKYLLIALLIGCAISFWQTIEYVIPLMKYLDMGLKGGMPHTVFNKWIGGDTYFLQGTLYFIVAPLLATLPFGVSFYRDRKSGYLKNVFTRTDKKYYYRAKYIATFLSGGVAGIVPLIFNFLSTAMFLPLILPEPTTGTFPLFEADLFADLFYASPYLFLCLYLVIDFVFFGLFAVVALAVGQYMENYFVVLLTPFLYYIVFMFLTNLTGNSVLNVQYLLMPAMGSRATPFIILTEAVILATVTGVLFFRKRKKDVY